MIEIIEIPEIQLNFDEHNTTCINPQLETLYKCKLNK